MNTAARLFGPALVLMGLVSAGCQQPDNRISLQEFLQKEEASKAASAAQVIQASPAVEQQFGPYKVGPGDVLQMVLSTGQQLPGPPTLLRVDREGKIKLPVVGPVQVGGKELEDVENAIRAAYVPGVFAEAVVHVDIAAPQTTKVVVRGAVTLPGLVQLRRTERNILHAIIGAGGLSQVAGGKATLRRMRNPGETFTYDLTDPVQVNEALALAPLDNGDIITVHSAQLNNVYIGGLVNRPAPLVLPPGVELTALQAFAGASGLRTDVTPKDGTLIRRMPDGSDVHVKLDLNRMSRGEDPNIVLAAGDILWVPDTLETKVQEWINRNIFMRAGVSVTYSVTGIEFLNRRELQGSGVSGNNQETNFDPLGFLNRNQALNDLGSQQNLAP